MRTVGIVCEYNPFHLGHARQLTHLRTQHPEAAIVCLMSGLYVQRGQPAVFSRQVRARAALLAGADLVLELPVTVSLRSAEGFAGGAVEILDRLGVEGLSFGAETADEDLLLATARLLLSPQFGAALRPHLDAGLSFPAARSRAVASLSGDPTALERPNDILAVEYCKAILARGSRLIPLPIGRPGDYHALEADRENPSATSLRRRILAGEPWLSYVPPETWPAYEGAGIHSLAFGERAVLARLRTLEEGAFAALPGASEGLWRKLFRACQQETNLEEILTAAKSKRYTRSRLDRMALCACLGLTARDLAEPAPYVRILGFRDRGRQVLREKSQSFPLAHSGQRMGGPYFDLEQRCTHLYGLFSQTLGAPEPQEQVIRI